VALPGGVVVEGDDVDERLAVPTDGPWTPPGASRLHRQVDDSELPCK
jgi:hypothetical protein